MYHSGDPRRSEGRVLGVFLAGLLIAIGGGLGFLSGGIEVYKSGLEVDRP